MDFRAWAESRSGLNTTDEVGRAFCAREITSLACSFVGTPYMWGGNSIKHFDCSGLVKFCYFMNGIILPRNGSQQIKTGQSVKDGEWQPGDLLFFGSKKPLKVTHVALYIGDGKIVHSSQKVRINTLTEYGREVPLVLYQLWKREPQVDGTMPRLRGVEHHGGGSCRSCQIFRRQGLAKSCLQ